MNNKLQKAEQEREEGKELSDAQMEKIMDLYINSIEIPEIKNESLVLLCPVGLVGAGKTTIITPICRKLNLVRISTDEIRKILQERGFNFVRTIELALKIIDHFLEKGKSVCIDADCISPRAQNYVEKTQREYNTLPVWIHINPPEEFIINKLRNYDHDWLFRDADHAISEYQRRKPLHEEHLQDIKFYFEFDSSKSNLEEQRNKFLTKLKSDFNI